MKGVQRRMIGAVAAAMIGVLTPARAASAVDGPDLDEFHWTCTTGQSLTACMGTLYIDLEPTTCFYDSVNSWYVEEVPYVYWIRWTTFRGTVKVVGDTLLGGNRKVVSDHTSGPNESFFARVVDSCG